MYKLYKYTRRHGRVISISCNSHNIEFMLRHGIQLLLVTPNGAFRISAKCHKHINAGIKQEQNIINLLKN